MTAAPSEPLLDVSGLTVELQRSDRGVEAVQPVVDEVSFRIEAGETFALVGESGCGKTVTALSLLRLIDPPLRIRQGSIRLEGEEILTLAARRLRRIRGRRMAMIFQEPMTALNPVLTVGEQVDEVLRLHVGLSRREARDRTVGLLGEVGIPDPRQRAEDYPHRLSGGMRQRVMIAMALACDPSLLIADEPTTALDVTVQAQILELLGELQATRGMSILLITHDLGVVAELAHRVAVMYAGRIVEEATAARLFESPAHPYTMGLFRSLPCAPDQEGDARRSRHLEPIPGSVPDAGAYPSGCRFHPRCAEVREVCAADQPRSTVLVDGHRVACHARNETDRVGGGES